MTCPSSPQANVKELMARALEMESQHWTQDVAPHRLDGHCHSELAIDIIQVPWSALWVHTHPASLCLCQQSHAHLFLVWAQAHV